MLKLAENLKLPIDVVTQTVAIVAKRRVGKSYTMRKLAEQLVHAKQQVVIVDPKGDQWGIRSAADGKGPGLPLVIIGGERGDVPLEVGAGELVAKLVVEERVSAVLDLSLLRKKEVSTFMAEFLEALYRLKAREVYRTPMMVVVDEADAIAPQKPMPGEERMLGAIEDIVRRGGQRGIGCVLVTQRTAVLNKNVLTQAQILVALRTIAPQDLKAMKEWIDVHGEETEREILMESLPSLPVGDAWFWSPGWPTEKGIFSRVHVLPIETFDSGATPKPGEKRREPKTVADVDLDALKRQMASTIENAKANDPRELRKRIVELERQVKAGGSGKPTPAAAAPKPAPPVVTDKQLAALEREAKRIFSITEAVAARLVKPLQAITQQLESIQGNIRIVINPRLPLAPAGQPLPRSSAPAAAPARHSAPPARRASAAEGAGDASVGNSGLRRMLIALAQRPQGLNRRQLGLRATVSSKGGSFDTYLSKGRVNGWIAGSRDNIQITDAGIAALGSYEPLPEGRALLDHYLREFGTSGAARMLQALADVYPRRLTRQELGDASNVSASGGSFDTYVSKLRTLELVEGGRDGLKASDELFDR